MDRKGRVFEPALTAFNEKFFVYPAAHEFPAHFI